MINNTLKEEVYEDDFGNDTFNLFISKLEHSVQNWTTESVLEILGVTPSLNIDEKYPMFILPNGKILSVGDVLEKYGWEDDFEPIHTSICHAYINILVDILFDSDEDKYEIYATDYILDRYADKMLDILTHDLGWARINCGKTWAEDRFYCVLPDNVTNAQFRTLEEWMYWGYEEGILNVMVYAKRSS